MAQGRISRAGARYPDAKRRARLYGRSRYGRIGRSLPPNLLPSASERDIKGRFLGGPVVILSTLAVMVAAFAIAAGVITAIGAAIGVAGTMDAYRDVNAELPNAAEIAVDTFQTTRIYDRNGVLLQEVDNPNPNAGWRTYVGIDQMDDNFINATVAAEDATFWTNEGVEPYAIVRGAFINITGAGSSGGSTITQQLVRAIYPDQINPMDISYSRKFREALAAYALAQEYSKTDIFSMYVNLIYYGNRAYGIEAAANTYFDKHATELTLAEAAFLAGLPQSPSYYAENFDQAKIRQRYVLDQMVEYRYITRAEAAAAYAEALTFREDIRTGAVSVDSAPHFTEYVRNYVIEHYGEDALYGGLEITTSIDLDLQHRAEQIVASGVADMLERGYGRNNAAMVVMVPWSGEVLAMVGSADFENALINGEVNYATSLIQPGSSMKPLVYATAFSEGLNPGSILFDVPTTWDVGGGQDPYEPQNYSGNFRGAITIRDALANSLNIPAVKATEYAGVQDVIDTTRAMGLENSLQEDASFYGLALGLGSGEVQLLEHTNAYATLANNGTHVDVHPILSIKDSQGNELFALDQDQVEKDSNQAIPAGNAYQVTSILTDNDARSMVFGSNNRFGETQSQLGRPTAAKSGTTDDWKDLWTMGYTTDVVVGVWTGTSGSGSTVGLPEVDGIQAAGPIWQDMMLELHDNPEFSTLLVGPDGNAVPEAFPVPDDAYEGEICAVTGHKPGKGETTEEWLVRDQGPTQDCGDLTEWEREQLDQAIEATRKGGVNWVGDAVNSIARYAAAAGVRGISVQEEEDERNSSNSNNVIEPADNQPAESGEPDDDVPIEEVPVDTEPPSGDTGSPTEVPIEPA